MATPRSTLESFIWGEGGAALTPEQIAARRKVENALVGKIDTSPVGHWTQGLARVADAFAGAVRRGQLDSAEKETTARGAADYDAAVKAMSGGATTSSPASIPMTGAANEVSSTSPVTGDTFQPFMDTIKAGGVDNPYALAAIAATGRAESGWSAANANRTWSDPSESGKPGTAGGIMSWRGPRYQALAATGDLSPQGQANFFLKEDPALIEKLKGAKSLEEAQQLMNNAWAFAGYNRPGGESSRRLSYAQGYLPSFQGGTQVASLDPSAGMSAANAIDAAATPSGYVDPSVNAQNAQQAQAPAFDAGRFGPRMNLAEMPPTRADIPAQMGTQTAALTAVPALDAPRTVSPAPAVASVPTQQVAQNGQYPAPPAPPSPPAPPQAPAQSPIMNEALLRAISSPYMTDGQRSVVQMLIQQQMQQQQQAREEQQWRARQDYQTQQQRADPAYQLEQDYKREQLNALRNKTAKNWQKLDDNTLFNPDTGETMPVGAPASAGGKFRFEGKSVEAQALNGLMEAGQITEGQAQQLGAGKTITGPNGEIIFMTPQGVFGKSADGTVSPMSAPQPQAPAGGVDIFGGAPLSPAAPSPPTPPQAPERTGMLPLTAPKVTVDESKAGGFADRMTQSGKLIDTYGNAGLNAFDQSITNSPYVPGFIANSLVGDDFQKYDQARRDFINAQLRRESGAVISPDEFDNANRQYFPQPGDKPEVLEQKRKSRETVINAMIRDAGPTYKAPSTSSGAPEKGTIEGGYRFKGGDPGNQSNWEKVQ